MIFCKQQIEYYQQRPLPKKIKIWKSESLIKEFKGKKKKVITFLGFGELGYNEPRVFNQIVRNELSEFDPKKYLVNTGTLITSGFENGITDVYRIAKRMAFGTTGVHPSIALESRSSYFLSVYEDYPYFVLDNTWGGYLNVHIKPSETLRTLLSISDYVIAIGGGKYTAQEINAFKELGKHVKYYTAEMNHKISSKWAKERGEKIIDFRGEAYFLINQTSENIVRL